MHEVDPGYGDPLASIGSEEWAKRWRLEFQGIAQDMPSAPERGLRYYQLGEKHRAWTLITDAEGKHFPTWEAFCAYRQPWGLGMDPVKFKAFIDAAVGPREADLITVSPGEDKGGRPRKGEETSASDAEVSGGASDRKAGKLRAILRAPEQVQDLYKEGLIRQTDAAKLGPRSPTPEQAAAIAQARERLTRLDRSVPPREFRRRAGQVVREALGVRERTALDRLVEWWAKASEEERRAFLKERDDEVRRLLDGSPSPKRQGRMFG
ncbi:MAG: hypothetical protein E6Q97_08575 [Desulfurellales bacterium]|nr:MAG: hypothetical protein E6Q97_08575 [Desulfurellales bacterium]